MEFNQTIAMHINSIRSNYTKAFDELTNKYHKDIMEIHLLEPVYDLLEKNKINVKFLNGEINTRVYDIYVVNDSYVLSPRRPTIEKSAKKFEINDEAPQKILDYIKQNSWRLKLGLAAVEGA